MTTLKFLKFRTPVNFAVMINLPRIQTKRPNLRDFPQNDANIIANSVNPDQTAPLCYL